MDEQKGHPSSRVLSHYWGCHQRFFRAMCMAMKVPSVCEMAKQALAENKCVVIGLQVQKGRRYLPIWSHGGWSPSSAGSIHWQRSPHRRCDAYRRLTCCGSEI